jgi:hypothetical protein
LAAERDKEPVSTARETAELAYSAINGDPVLRRMVVEDHPFYWISVPMS